MGNDVVIAFQANCASASATLSRVKGRLGRTEPAHGDYKVCALERLAHGFGQMLAIIANDGLPNHFDAEFVQSASQVGNWCPAETESATPPLWQ